MRRFVVILFFIVDCFLHVNLMFASNVKFYSINDMYGVSMREINSICKDYNGFIWASSKTGIVRVGDDDYRVYYLPYETANIISVKLSYDNNKLFAFTNNGQLFYYNPINDRFDLIINMSRELKSNYLSVNSLVVDSESRLWIGSSAGLFMYDQEGLHWVNEIGGIVSSLERIDGNRLAFTIFNTLNVIDVVSMKNEKLTDFTIRGMSPITHMNYDSKLRRLWIGTVSSGLLFYDFNQSSLKKANIENFPLQPILAITQNTDSTLLCGIDGQGIWEIEKYSQRVANVYKDNSDDPYSLRGNGVYDIYCDENHRVWVGTYSGGLSFFDQASSELTQVIHSSNNKNSLVNNDVNSVIEDRRGNLWFATNNGISFWNPSTNQWKSFYHNTQKQAQVFMSLCEDRDGNIWAGTYSSGVYLLDGNSGAEIAHYSTSGPEGTVGNDFVFNIFRDRGNNIWIGGVQGNLIGYHVAEKIFIAYAPLPIYSVNELDDNYLLLGCTFGLVKFNKNDGSFQNLVEGYLIYDILVHENVIWLCTSGDGVIKYDLGTGETKKFTMSMGLPSNFVNSIILNNGFLWVGTENGLCRIDPKTENIKNYSSNISLSNVSFNLNSSFKLKNGNLIFGTNSGALIFNPFKLQQGKPGGKIFIQDLVVSGRSIRDKSVMSLATPVDSLKKVKLKHNQNTITVEMVPMGVTEIGSQFSWKMEGLDKDWSQPGNLRKLTYTNIPSGEFVLKIRMLDSSLTNVIDEREIQFDMVPPFWRTWWFLSILLVLGMIIISFSFLYYIDKLRETHSEEKIKFFTNTTHDLRTSLTLINAPIEELGKEKNLSSNGRYYLELALEQTARLVKISTQLLDFQKIDIGREQLSLEMIDIVSLLRHRMVMFESFAAKHNVKLVFSSEQEEYFTAIDESMVEKVIDNLISNAIKYSKSGGEVLVTFDGKVGTWSVEVADQGIGISKKAQRQLFKEFYRGENAVNSKIVGSGIGLLLAKKYVVMHGGRITCTSQEDVGSEFKIIMPYNQTSELGAIKGEIKPTVKESVESEENESNGTKENLMRILVVEDNEDLRNFMKHPLKEQFQVSTACDGEKAWKIIQRDLPDIVISDVMMPNMDGFELCRLMKSTFETSHIPIILLTALNSKSEQLHGLGLGADDYLTKPFDMGLLIQRAKTILRNREQIRDRALKLIKGSEMEAETIFENELNDKFMKKALAIVADNLSNSAFGKDEFASEMNVSTSLLYKKIKSLTDQSPSEFIKLIRLNNALQLLKTKRYSVTEVSEMCGFSSVGYFGTVFKKHFGKLPTDILV